MIDDESDYVVEEYIKPKKVRVPLINDERADLLGNFDDTKFDKTKQKGKIKFDPEENPFADNEHSDSDEGNENDDNDEAERDDQEDNNSEVSDSNEEVDDGDNGDEEQVQEENVDTNGDDSSDETVNETDDQINKGDNQGVPKSQTASEATTSDSANHSGKSNKKSKKNKKSALDKNATSSDNSGREINDQQFQSLMRGVTKQNRFVLYITNLNYETTRDKLSDFFSTAGTVKSVRIPKTRKTAFAFVEMTDVNGFKVAKLNSIRYNNIINSNAHCD